MLSNNFFFIALYIQRSINWPQKCNLISARFQAMFENNFWHELAAHANSTAKYFEKKIKKFTRIKTITYAAINAVLFRCL
jgi:threonine aldolase